VAACVRPANRPLPRWFRVSDQKLEQKKEERMTTDDPDKVWPTGLTLPEAEEIHSYLIDGTRVFGAIAVLAHLLVAFATPWLG
jgi:light-harvesting protein B-800-850 beta chain